MTIIPGKSDMCRLTLRLAGSMAAAVLETDGTLETLAVFKRSFYVSDRNGRLACFVRDDSEPGPINLLCSGWPTDLRALLAENTAMSISGGVISSSSLQITLTDMRLWRAPDLPCPGVEQVRAGVRAFLQQAQTRCPVDSMATLLWKNEAPPASSNLHKAILATTANGVAKLRNWLRGCGHENGVTDLLGLGGGLTPSGDDILGGALIGLRAMGYVDAASQLAKEVLRQAGAQTNRISRAHLEAAASGMGAAVLHDCLSEMLTDGAGLPAILERLGNVGHTSGWDAVLGLLIVLGCYGDDVRIAAPQ